MFRISRRLDYGLQLMIALAAGDGDQPVPSARLSEQLQIPLPFLHQIAHTLMQSGLIKASPGPRGGLRLNSPADTITVLKIAEVLEGPINITPGVEIEDNCIRQESCATQSMWDDLQSKIINYMVTHTLDVLVKRSVDYKSFVVPATEAKQTKTPITAD
ncbi:MAG TPA: Rrf2 family transcriptional regulator [Bellilinea sp.]|nr:Rrf2 family transcriptional regulator [Bellilinea sp.]